MLIHISNVCLQSRTTVRDFQSLIREALREEHKYHELLPPILN
jgi:hypothetical protein